MVTDRDLVLRVMAAGRSPLEAKVGEVMTPGLYFCYDDEEAESAASLWPRNRYVGCRSCRGINKSFGIV